MKPILKIDTKTPGASPRPDKHLNIPLPKEDKGNLSDTSPERKAKSLNVRQNLVKSIKLYEKLLLRGDQDPQQQVRLQKAMADLHA